MNTDPTLERDAMLAWFDAASGKTPPTLAPDRAVLLLMMLGQAVVNIVHASAWLGHAQIGGSARDYIAADYPPRSDHLAACAVVRDAFSEEMTPVDLLSRHPWLVSLYPVAAAEVAS